MSLEIPPPLIGAPVTYHTHSALYTPLIVQVIIPSIAVSTVCISSQVSTALRLLKLFIGT